MSEETTAKKSILSVVTTLVGDVKSSIVGDLVGIAATKTSRIALAVVFVVGVVVGHIV